jgi:hypothetical protein
MADKVKPLKLETSIDGTQNDVFPTEVNPTQDYIASKGVAFENNDNRLIDLDVSGNIQFKDVTQATPFRINKLVKDFGTPAHSLTASVQATANSTKTLTITDNTVQIFTGATAGQIVKLPVATTLTVGHLFEVWNLSSQTVSIRDNGNNILATINSSGRTQIILYNNSTANGQWSLTYSLDNGNVFGTQIYYAEAIAETSTSSTTTFLNKITLVTPSLPLGNYLCQFQFIWRAGNANRTLDVRVQRGGVNIQAWNPFTANLADRQLLSGFVKIDNISGVQTFTLDFKVFGTATTVYMQLAKLFVWRIA